MNDTRIIYANEEYFPSFREALNAVAQERIYIEMIEAPPLEGVAEFQKNLIGGNSPAYYALDGSERVVGWCDITPKEGPRLKHRGTLGMGIIPEFRGRGIGSKLMSAALAHAKICGLEKVELTVYASNARAFALYKKHGFEQEGYIRKHRKLDEQYFDCIAMGMFL